MLDYIIAELQTYFELDQDLHRRAEIIDNRVHACLYFMAPHRLKDVDIEFMKRLCPVVNLIPVIAKADTMTTAELLEYKELIAQKLRHNKITTYPPLPSDTSPSAGVEQRCPPFAVIGSNELVLS